MDRAWDKGDPHGAHEPASGAGPKLPARGPEEVRTAPAPRDSVFWRRAAQWGSNGPRWWKKYGPPVFGWAAAACVPAARRAVQDNLQRLRGPRSPVREVGDVLATFGTYASCLAEVLANDERTPPRAIIFGERHARAIVHQRRGIVLVTAHTAGWDLVGPLLGETYGLDLILVTHAEPDARAGQLQDDARRHPHVAIAHVGDPLASLPLLRHLRQGGVVALQLDRVVPGMRTRTVPLLGAASAIPEGPFRLAQLSGAPILPIFCARRGHREYLVEVFEPRYLDRRASEATVDEAAAHVASCMTRFLRAHPTQWFQFGGA